MFSDEWLNKYRTTKKEYESAKEHVYKLFVDLTREVHNCPFCGSKASLFIDEDDNKCYRAKIQCQNYDCHVSKSGYPHRNITDAELDSYRIVYTWNRRVNNSNNERK